MTRIWALALGLAMSWSAYALDPVHSDGCGCTVQPDELRDLPKVDPDADIHLGSYSRMMFFALSAWPDDEFGSGSLAGVLDGITGRNGYTPQNEVTYGEIGGHPAAWVEARRKWEKSKWREQITAIDAGDRLLVAVGFTKPSLWYDNGPRLERILASLEIDPPAPQELSLTEWPITLASEPLLEARRGHVPATRDLRGTSELDAPDEAHRARWTRTTYPGPLGDNAAWATKNPGDGERHPAVIWIPSGLTGPGSGVFDPLSRYNSQSAAILAEAGLAVFVPTFRGQADNPGEAEFFFGETEDLLAAIAHVKGRPWVDPERVYVVGAGTGGTHALNVAAAGAQVRAIVSYGGTAWQMPMMALGGYEQQPFAVTDEEAAGFRSAIFWADRLQSPVVHVTHDGDYSDDAQRMAELATESGCSMEVHTLPFGGRVQLLRPVQELLVRRILDDDGPTTSVSFTEEDWYGAIRRAYPGSTRLGG